MKGRILLSFLFVIFGVLQAGAAEKQPAAETKDKREDVSYLKAGTWKPIDRSFCKKGSKEKSEGIGRYGGSFPGAEGLGSFGGSFFGPWSE